MWNYVIFEGNSNLKLVGKLFRRSVINVAYVITLYGTSSLFS